MTIELYNVIRVGVLASRPAAGNHGAIYFATDTGLVYFDGGASWTAWGPLGAASAIVAAAAIANTETVVTSYVCTANELAAGTTFAIRAYASRAGTVSASPIIRVRVGATTLTGNIAATITPPVNTLAVPNEIEGLVTVRTAGVSGTVIGSLRNSVHLAAVTISPAIGTITSAVAVDTTAVIRVELTFISGDAGNTYSFQEASINKIKA